MTMRTLPLGGVLLLALGVIAVPTAAHADFLIDGGFETPVAPNNFFTKYAAGSTFGGSGASTGWTVVGNDVLIVNTGYSEPGIRFNAYAGSQMLDLTGAHNTPGNSIAQTVATTPGTAYLLSFVVGNAQENPVGSSYYDGPSLVTVAATGTDAVTYTNADITLGQVNWKPFTYGFVAHATSTTVSFTNATAVSDGYAGLDAISLVQDVPEPASLLLLGAGLLAAEVLRRHRPGKGAQS